MAPRPKAKANATRGPAEDRTKDDEDSDTRPDSPGESHGGGEGEKSKKIMLTSIAPDGSRRKFVIKRNFKVQEIRQTVAVMAGRLTQETELMLNGEVLVDCRSRPFENSDGPYEIHWMPGDRMLNMLTRNNLKSKISRAPGTKGLNRTALHFACMSGDIDLAKEVVEDKEVQPKAKALVNAQDTFGDTALHFAAILGFEDLVEFLCDRGADTEIMNIHKRTALMYAAEHGHNDAVRALLHCGASLASKNLHSKVPNAKHLAKLNGRTNVLVTIREHEKAADLEEEFLEMAMMSMEEAGEGDGDDHDGAEEGQGEYFQKQPIAAEAEDVEAV